MPRDSRRRSSPESSRRRRAERRASREQLATVAPMPMAQQQPQYSPSPSYAPPPTQQQQQPYSPALQSYAPSTTTYTQQPYPPIHHPPPSTMPPQRTRAGSSSSNNTSTSSTSSSLLNISRKSRFGIKSFFTSSSRTRRSSKKRARQRAFRKNNTSSSSVDSDLAYGHGYIPKTAVSSPVPGHIAPEQRMLGDGRPLPVPLTRKQTDEEILELGRQLSVYARAQNERDLRKMGRVRPSTLVAGAAALGALSRRDSGRDKGIGGSKPGRRHDDSPDDEDWESASDGDDDESSSDGYDAGLAYGSVPKFSDTHLPPKPTYTASVVPESVMTAAPTIISQPPPEEIRPPNRKPSAVDPAMFGPVNSLRGYVNTPCGFRPGEYQSPQHAQAAQLGYGGQERRDSASNEANRPMRVVYPVPTSDPNRFETASTVVSGYSQQQSPSLVSRPAPVPIQAPKPISPDKFRVLEGREEDRYRDEKRKSNGSKLAGAAAVGVAAAAIGEAVLSSRGKREGEEREREARRAEEERWRRAEEDRRREKEARRLEEDRPREKEARRLEEESVIALQREKEARRIVEEREKEARRLSEERALAEAQLEKRRQYAAKAESGGQDIIVEVRRSRDEPRRDAPKSKDKGKQVARSDVLVVDDKKAEEARRAARKAEKAARKAKEAEERRLELERIKAEIERLKGDEPQATSRAEKGGRSSSAGPSQPRQIDMPPVDPFQFQVEDDAFHTPKYGATPQIVAVEREPKWDDDDEVVTLDPPERMSRKDSHEHELAMLELAEARAIHREAEETTYPVDIGTATAAISVIHAAEASKRGAREAEPNRDPIKEADEWYREKKLSERLHREEIRSRSASPEPSVLDKYDIVEEPQERIPTPPAMAKNKNKFDSPNADVKIDNEIWPHQLDRFKYPPGASLRGDGPRIWVSRDPSCERERPVLNIVRPTPTHSPAPPEDRKGERSVSPARDKGKERERSKSPTSNVRMGPRGEIIEEPEPQPETKSVTWGENDTKHYDPEHKPSEAEEKAARAEKIREIVYGKGKKKSALTGLAAALAAAAAAGTIAGAAASDKSQDAREATVDEAELEPVVERGRSRSRSRSRSPAPETRGRSKSPLPFEPTVERGRSRTRSPIPQQYEARGRSKSPLPGSFGQERSRSPPAPVTEPGRSRSPLPQRAQRSKSPMPRAFHDTQLHDDHDQPPQPGPKPATSPEASHMPGAFDDDLDFTATLAAGLQSSGFDPNIVIEDPSYRRRDSPPGSNAPGSGFIIGEVPETLASEKDAVVREAEPEADGPKISNKERKRREKAARLALEKEREAEVEPELQKEIRSVVAASEFASRQVRDENEPVLSKKEQKKRKSLDGDAPPAPSDVSVEASNDLQPAGEDESEETPRKSKRKSKRDSTYETYDSPSRDVAAAEVSVETTSSGKKGKKSRRSTKDSYDIPPDEEDPPDRRRRRSEKDFVDRDVSSVVSAPGRYDDRYNGDHDDIKSTVSERTNGKRSSGFFSMFKSNGSNSEEKKAKEKDSKDNKQSFLGKAGTLGEGAGLAGAALALMGLTDSSRDNAADDGSEEPSATEEPDASQPPAGERQSPSQSRDITPTGRPRSISLGSHTVDPEIIQRQIKPAIDPQYGDLLPLPPSEPGTPKFEVDDVETLPSLPESRPNTPPTLDVKKTHVRRRSALETPTKSPSQTAIPIHFRLGQRSMPNSPAMARSSPVIPQSPSFASSSMDVGSGKRSRPNSWGREMLGEIKPLYLVEKTSSIGLGKEVEERGEYPELPPSGPPSRESPGPEFEGPHGDVEYFTPSMEPNQLRLDTAVAAALGGSEPLGSAELTPRAQWVDEDEFPLHSPRTGGSEAGDEFPLASVGTESVDDFHSAAESPMQSSPPMGEGVLAEWPEMEGGRRRSGSDASSVVVEFHRRHRDAETQGQVEDLTKLSSVPGPLVEESHITHGASRPMSAQSVLKQAEHTETIPERWISDFSYEGFAQLTPLPESTGSSLVEEPLHGDIVESSSNEQGPSELNIVSDIRDLAQLPPLPPSTGTSLVDEPISRVAPEEGPLTTPTGEEPEPIDPVTKNRSSYLLYQTPSTTKSVASFETARDHTPPSPSRKHDDLDIAAGVAAGVFGTGVVAALLHDSASKDNGPESVAEEKLDSPAGSMHSAEELLTPDEMSMTGQGKRKNKKKGRKGKGKEVDSPIEQELAPEAGSSQEGPRVAAEEVSVHRAEESSASAKDELVHVAEEVGSSQEDKLPAMVQEQDVTHTDRQLAQATEADDVSSEPKEGAAPSLVEEEKQVQPEDKELPLPKDDELAVTDRNVLGITEVEKSLDIKPETSTAMESGPGSQEQAEVLTEATSSKKTKKKKKKAKQTTDAEPEQPVAETPLEPVAEPLERIVVPVAEPEIFSTPDAPKEVGVVEADVERNITPEELNTAIETQLPASVPNTRPTSPVQVEEPVEVPGTAAPSVEEATEIPETSTLTAEEAAEIATEEAAIAALKTKKANNKKKKLNKTDQAELNRLEERARLREEARSKQIAEIKPEPSVGATEQLVLVTEASTAEPPATQTGQPVAEAEKVAADATVREAALEPSTTSEHPRSDSPTPRPLTADYEQPMPDVVVALEDPVVQMGTVEAIEPVAQTIDTERDIAAQTQLPVSVENTRPSSPVQEPDVSGPLPQESVAEPEPSVTQPEMPATEVEALRSKPEMSAPEPEQVIPGAEVKSETQDENNRAIDLPMETHTQDKELELAAGTHLPVSIDSTRPSSPTHEATTSSTAEDDKAEVLAEVAEEEAAIAALKAKKAGNKKKKLNKTDQAELNRLEERAKLREEAKAAVESQTIVQVPSLDQEQTLVAEPVPAIKEMEPTTAELVETKEEKLKDIAGLQEDNESKQPAIATELPTVELKRPTAEPEQFAPLLETMESVAEAQPEERKELESSPVVDAQEKELPSAADTPLPGSLDTTRPTSPTQEAAEVMPDLVAETAEEEAAIAALKAKKASNKKKKLNKTDQAELTRLEERARLRALQPVPEAATPAVEPEMTTAENEQVKGEHEKSLGDTDAANPKVTPVVPMEDVKATEPTTKDDNSLSHTVLAVQTERSTPVVEPEQPTTDDPVAQPDSGINTRDVTPDTLPVETDTPDKTLDLAAETQLEISADNSRPSSLPPTTEAEATPPTVNEPAPSASSKKSKKKKKGNQNTDSEPQTPTFEGLAADQPPAISPAEATAEAPTQVDQVPGMTKEDEVGNDARALEFAAGTQLPASAENTRPSSPVPPFAEKADEQAVEEQVIESATPSLEESVTEGSSKKKKKKKKSKQIDDAELESGTPTRDLPTTEPDTSKDLDLLPASEAQAIPVDQASLPVEHQPVTEVAPLAVQHAEIATAEGGNPMLSFEEPSAHQLEQQTTNSRTVETDNKTSDTTSSSGTQEGPSNDLPSPSQAQPTTGLESDETPEMGGEIQSPEVLAEIAQEEAAIAALKSKKASNKKKKLNKTDQAELNRLEEKARLREVAKAARAVKITTLPAEPPSSDQQQILIGEPVTEPTEAEKSHAGLEKLPKEGETMGETVTQTPLESQINNEPDLTKSETESRELHVEEQPVPVSEETVTELDSRTAAEKLEPPTGNEPRGLADEETLVEKEAATGTPEIRKDDAEKEIEPETSPTEPAPKKSKKKKAKKGQLLELEEPSTPTESFSGPQSGTVSAAEPPVEITERIIPTTDDVPSARGYDEAPVLGVTTGQETKPQEELAPAFTAEPVSLDNKAVDTQNPSDTSVAAGAVIIDTPSVPATVQTSTDEPTDTIQPIAQNAMDPVIQESAATVPSETTSIEHGSNASVDEPTTKKNKKKKKKGKNAQLIETEGDNSSTVPGTPAEPTETTTTLGLEAAQEDPLTAPTMKAESSTIDLTPTPGFEEQEFLTPFEGTTPATAMDFVTPFEERGAVGMEAPPAEPTVPVHDLVATITDPADASPASPNTPLGDAVKNLLPEQTQESVDDLTLLEAADSVIRSAREEDEAADIAEEEAALALLRAKKAKLKKKKKLGQKDQDELNRLETRAKLREEAKALREAEAAASTVASGPQPDASTEPTEPANVEQLIPGAMPETPALETPEQSRGAFTEQDLATSSTEDKVESSREASANNEGTPEKLVEEDAESTPKAGLLPAALSILPSVGVVGSLLGFTNSKQEPEAETIEKQASSVDHDTSSRQEVKEPAAPANQETRDPTSVDSQPPAEPQLGESSGQGPEESGPTADAAANESPEDTTTGAILDTAVSVPDESTSVAAAIHDSDVQLAVEDNKPDAPATLLHDVTPPIDEQRPVAIDEAPSETTDWANEPSAGKKMGKKGKKGKGKAKDDDGALSSAVDVTAPELATVDDTKEAEPSQEAATVEDAPDSTDDLTTTQAVEVTADDEWAVSTKKGKKGKKNKQKAQAAVETPLPESVSDPVATASEEAGAPEVSSQDQTELVSETAKNEPATDSPPDDNGTVTEQPPETPALEKTKEVDAAVDKVQDEPPAEDTLPEATKKLSKKERRKLKQASQDSSTDLSASEPAEPANEEPPLTEASESTPDSSKQVAAEPSQPDEEVTPPAIDSLEASSEPVDEPQEPVVWKEVEPAPVPAIETSDSLDTAIPEPQEALPEAAVTIVSEESAPASSDKQPVEAYAEDVTEEPAITGKKKKNKKKKKASGTATPAVEEAVATEEPVVEGTEAAAPEVAEVPEVVQTPVTEPVDVSAAEATEATVTEPLQAPENLSKELEEPITAEPSAEPSIDAAASNVMQQEPQEAPVTGDDSPPDEQSMDKETETTSKGLLPAALSILPSVAAVGTLLGLHTDESAAATRSDKPDESNTSPDAAAEPVPEESVEPFKSEEKLADNSDLQTSITEESPEPLAEPQTGEVGEAQEAVQPVASEQPTSQQPVEATAEDVWEAPVSGKKKKKNKKGKKTPEEPEPSPTAAEHTLEEPTSEEPIAEPSQPEEASQEAQQPAEARPQEPLQQDAADEPQSGVPEEKSRFLVDIEPANDTMDIQPGLPEEQSGTFVHDVQEVEAAAEQITHLEPPPSAPAPAKKKSIADLIARFEQPAAVEPAKLSRNDKKEMDKQIDMEEPQSLSSKAKEIPVPAMAVEDTPEETDAAIGEQGTIAEPSQELAVEPTVQGSTTHQDVPAAESSEPVTESSKGLPSDDADMIPPQPNVSLNDATTEVQPEIVEEPAEDVAALPSKKSKKKKKGKKGSKASDVSSEASSEENKTSDSTPNQPATDEISTTQIADGPTPMEQVSSTMPVEEGTPTELIDTAEEPAEAIVEPGQTDISPVPNTEIATESEPAVEHQEAKELPVGETVAVQDFAAAAASYEDTIKLEHPVTESSVIVQESPQPTPTEDQGSKRGYASAGDSASVTTFATAQEGVDQFDKAPSPTTEPTPDTTEQATPVEVSSEANPFGEDISALLPTSPYSLSLRNSRERRKRSPEAETRPRAASPSSSNGVIVMGREARKPDDEEEEGDLSADSRTSLTSTTLKRSKKDRKRSGSQTKQNSEDSESPSGLTLSEDSWTTPPMPVTQLSTIMEGSTEDLRETDNKRVVDTAEGEPLPEDTSGKSRELDNADDGGVRTPKDYGTVRDAQADDMAQNAASDTPVDVSSEERDLKVPAAAAAADVASTEDTPTTGKKGKKGKKAKKNKKTALPWDEPEPGVDSDPQVEVTRQESKELVEDVSQETADTGIDDTVSKTEHRELLEEGIATTEPESSHSVDLPTASEAQDILSHPPAIPVEEHLVTDAVIFQIDQLEALPVETLPSAALPIEIETPSLETTADLAASDDKPSTYEPIETVIATEEVNKEPGEFQTDEEWALPSKKSKKDKKKKAKKGTSTPGEPEHQSQPEVVEAQPAESSSQEETSTPAAPKDVSEPQEDTSDNQELQASGSQPQETKEELALSANMSEKQKKQAEKLVASLAEPAQQPEAVVEEPSAKTGTREEEENPVTTTSESLSRVLADIEAVHQPEPSASEEPKEVPVLSLEQPIDPTPVLKAATPDIPASDGADGSLQDRGTTEAVTEPAADEDEWAFPAKKSKKDKKKKKKGKAAERAESDSMSGTSTPTAEDAPVEVLEPMTTRERELPASQEIRSSGVVEGAPVLSLDLTPPVENTPVDVSEQLPSQEEEVPPTPEETKARDVVEEPSEKVQEDAQESIKPEPTDNQSLDVQAESEARALAPEQVGHPAGDLPVTDAILAQIDNLEALPAEGVLPVMQFEEPPTPQVEPAVGDVVTETTTVIPPEPFQQEGHVQADDEWAVPDKKSKKGKKKNKKGPKASEDSASPSGTQTPTVEEPNPSASVEVTAEPAVIAGEPAPVAEEASITEVAEKSAPAVDLAHVVDPETQPTPEEKSTETVDDVTAHEVAEDTDAASATEKAMPILDATPAVEPTPEALPSTEPQPDTPTGPDTAVEPETQPEELWAMPSKKSKKDKKKKGRQSTSAADSGTATPAVQENVVSRELDTAKAEPAAPADVQEAQAEDEWAETTAKKSKKDKKRKGKQTAEMLAGAAAAVASVIPGVSELLSDDKETETRPEMEASPARSTREVVEPTPQEASEQTTPDNSVPEPTKPPAEPRQQEGGGQGSPAEVVPEPTRESMEPPQAEPESVWKALVKKGKKSLSQLRPETATASESKPDEKPRDNDTFEISPAALGFTELSSDQGLKALLPGIETANLAASDHPVLPPVTLPSPELLTGSPPPKELLGSPLEAPGPALVPAEETSATAHDVPFDNNETHTRTENDDGADMETRRPADKTVEEEATGIPATEEPIPVETKPEPSPREVAAQLLEKPGATGISKAHDEPVSEAREIAASWLESKVPPTDRSMEEGRTEDVPDELQPGVSPSSEHDGHDNDKATEAAAAAGGVALLAKRFGGGSKTKKGKAEKMARELLEEPGLDDAHEQEPAVKLERSGETKSEEDKTTDKDTASVTAEATIRRHETDLNENRNYGSPSRSIPYMSSIPDLRRSLISLPPVQEEEVEEEHGKEQQQHLMRTPEVNRDSGFISDSATPRRRSRHYEDDSHRDSGVHLRDWPESTPPRTSRRDLEAHPARTSGSSLKAETHSYHQETPRSESRQTASISTPEVSRISGSSGLAQTPKLKEPSPPATTPEPHKISVKKRTATKQLDREPEPAARNVGAPLTVPSPAPSERRVVSDHSALHHRGESLRRSPASSDLSMAARRSASNTSMSRLRTPEPLNLRPDSPGSVRSLHSATPPLRRNRISGDLRAVSLGQRSLSELSASSAATPANKDKGNNKEAATAAAALGVGVAAGAAALALASNSSRASANTTPVANEGRVRSKDMADVYDGYGEGRIGSPRSPTRPHSMRRRQSMQVLDLENKVRELEAENLALSQSRSALEHSANPRASGALAERDATIGQLKQNLAFLQKEVERLTEVNEGLNSANAQIAVTHSERYRDLESKHADAIRELEQARSPTGVLREKDAEIARLRVQLEEAKQKIRTMQDQILESSPGTDAPDYLRSKDVDYFDHRCQQLCNHVQQWVLRFSKFSDMRACRLTSEINDEKIIDRLDNAVLDGSDVDTYLNDRVRRRDIFMSMTMTMIWEFIFTRYLFGMDREQRQKLKSLEKILLEVGPPHAVRQWRAITLTLLARRPQFKQQRDTDTEAVVQAIFQTLSVILPPPTNMEDQIQSQLRKVMREAVDLAIEMRTQRAEYMMLPPLQPEYDDTGELTETVSFNAALMNERSDSGTSNEDWEAAHSIVRIVLFPLVVKKGDDSGVGDDEVVVSPAQVLVAKPEKKRTIRMVTPSSDAGGASLISRSERMSTASPAGTMRHGNGSDVRMGDAPFI